MNILPYLIINNVNSQTIQGLIISELAPISKPQQRTRIEEIDGRDGDLVTPLGFAAYDKTVKIGLSYGYDIDEIIEFFNASGVVTFSNEPDKYYRFAIYQQIDFEKLIRFKTADVVFHCQPFKFSTTEEPLLFDVSSGSPITVTNEGNTDSRPNILVLGNDNIDVSLNGSQILSIGLGDEEQAVIIDTEDMNAYGAQSAIKEVIAEINPVQDLHGQEYPYPAGGGKNKLDPSLLLDQTVWNTITITLSPNTTYIMSTNMPNDTGLSLFFFNSTSNPSSGNVVYQGHNIPATTNEDGIVKIQQRRVSGSDSFQNYQWQVEQGSTATPYAPYENICPITGFTEANVTRLGANLFGGVAFYAPLVANGATLNTTEKTVSYTGAIARATDVVFDKFKPNTRYTVIIKVKSSNTNANAKIYYTDGTSTTISGQSGITGEYTFVTTSTEGKSVKSFGFSWVSGTVVAYYDECGIFEGVLTAEDFESYLGEVYNIPFVDDQGDPITAYGGKINATTGVLTIDKKYLLLNTAGTFYQSGYAAYMDITDAFINNEYGEAITNRYKFGTWSEATASGINGTFTLYKNTAWSNGRLAFSLDGQTIADFRASLSTNPIEVVYKLATPIEIQLTPTQINNLLGLNQLYTDTNGNTYPVREQSPPR